MRCFPEEIAERESHTMNSAEVRLTEYWMLTFSLANSEAQVLEKEMEKVQRGETGSVHQWSAVRSVDCTGRPRKQLLCLWVVLSWRTCLADTGRQLKLVALRSAGLLVSSAWHVCSETKPE